jgi:hypothetical protein
MFETKLQTKDGHSVSVSEKLMPISPEKYPALTAEEAQMSLPLQTVVIAIFDAIMVVPMPH